MYEPVHVFALAKQMRLLRKYESNLFCICRPIISTLPSYPKESLKKLYFASSKQLHAYSKGTQLIHRRGWIFVYIILLPLCCYFGLNSLYDQKQTINLKAAKRF